MSAATPTLSTKAPETMRQAQRWEAYRGWYGHAGLCDRCAAQAAYGHQHGFSQVRPPCWECSTVVGLLPHPEVNGWRSGDPKMGRSVLAQAV